MSTRTSYLQRVNQRDETTYLGVHFLDSKSLDNSDGFGGSLLEGNTMESLVHVQGVVSSSTLNFLLSTLFGSGHLDRLKNK